MLGNLLTVVRLFWAEADSFVRSRLALAALFVLGSSTLAAVAPAIFKVALDAYSDDHPRTLYLAPLLLVGLYVLTQGLERAFNEFRWLAYLRAEQRANRRLSLQLFEHVMGLPLRFHLDRKTGAVSETLSNGLFGYRMILQSAVFAVLPVIVEIAVIAIVLTRLYRPLFATILGLSAVLYAMAFVIGAKRIMEASHAVSAAKIDASALMTDSIVNYETVKYFDAEAQVHRRFDEALAHAERQWARFSRRHVTNGLSVAIIFTLSLGTSIFFATQEVEQGAMTITDFVLVNAYVLRIAAPMEMLGFALRDIAQGMAFIGKMLDLMTERRETRRTPGHQLPRGSGQLVFEHISFSYAPERMVLKDISFVIAPGTTCAIVGSSGSGKSSLVRLIVRLYEPASGRILLDDTPISEIPMSKLRQAIAVVPQDPVLFNDSIAYNIAFGRPGTTEDEIECAARLAHIHRFVRNLPAGYNTTVGERGLKLSGGERQRVAIARAAIKRPRVFVFDEATSSLDTETERDIMRDLIEVSRGVTTLLIAHRLSTVVHADEIIVLHHGEIAERGDHASLLRLDGIYAAMWRAQQHGRSDDDEHVISAA